MQKQGSRPSTLPERTVRRGNGDTEGDDRPCSCECPAILFTTVLEGDLGILKSTFSRVWVKF
jgi:hypothetical protein